MAEKQKKVRRHPVLRGIITAVCALLALAVLDALIVASVYRFSFKNLERIDSDGALYYLEYNGNYESRLISFVPGLFKGSGCSVFCTRDENGEVLTGRNYDVPHINSEGETTGLNVVVKLSGGGKYDSINMADACWISSIGLPYYNGALDGGCTKIPLGLLPWLCMDGMNEMGLTVSILYLDTKEGESAVYQNDEGKDSVMISQLLRRILDNCADLEEAVACAGSCNLVNLRNGDYHLFVTDAAGSSAVFEWRYNNFTVTYTDVSTNFYVGYDDAEDCYFGDELKEAFETPAKFTREYRYGYGHGYGRFAVVASALEKHMTEPAALYTEMTSSEAMGVLESVYQAYDPDSLTSMTQYSCVYHNSEGTLDVCVMGDYDTVYSFSLNK